MGKRVFRKKNRQRRKNVRRHRKRSRVPADVWINHQPLASKSFIPRRIMTKVCQTQSGYVIANTQSGGYFAIDAASFDTPFAAVTPTIFTLANSGITATTNFAANQQVNGYTQLTNMYNTYKVHGCKIRINVTPASSSDTVLYACYPSVGQSSSLNVRVASEQMYAKSRTANSGGNAKFNTLEMYHRSQDILGVNKAEYNGFPPNPVTGAPPDARQNWYYNIHWQEIDNANASNVVYFEVELEMYLELENVNTFSN